MSVLRRIASLQIRRVWTQRWQFVHNYFRVDNGAGSREQAAGKHLSFVLCTLIFVIQPSGAESQLNECDLRGPEGAALPRTCRRLSPFRNG